MPEQGHQRGSNAHYPRQSSFTHRYVTHRSYQLHSQSTARRSICTTFISTINTDHVCDTIRRVQKFLTPTFSEHVSTLSTSSNGREGILTTGYAYQVTVLMLCVYTAGQDTTVGTATRYGLTVQDANPGGSEVFRTSPDLSWGPPSLLYNGHGVSFPEESGRGVALTTHST